MLIPHQSSRRDRLQGISKIERSPCQSKFLCSKLIAQRKRIAVNRLTVVILLRLPPETKRRLGPRRSSLKMRIRAKVGGRSEGKEPRATSARRIDAISRDKLIRARASGDTDGSPRNVIARFHGGRAGISAEIGGFGRRLHSSPLLSAELSRGAGKTRQPTVTVTTIQHGRPVVLERSAR